MSRKHCFVCLLTLAGSVSFLSPAVVDRQVPSFRSFSGSQKTGSEKFTVRDSPEFGLPEASRAVLKARATSLAGKTAFEPNVGQAGASAQFVARGNGMSILLVRNGFDLVVPGHAPGKKSLPGSEGANSLDATVHVRLAQGASLSWDGEEKLTGETNYFLGNDPAKWRTHVPRFARARASLNANSAAIDVYGNEEGLEYDLRIPPGTDASRFRFELAGAKRLRLDPDGDLLFNVASYEVKMRKPMIYEVVASANQVSTAAERHPAASQTGSLAPAGPKKKRTRRTTTKSEQKQQRHRARKKIRGEAARPPAMKRPRTNSPQKRKRPPKVDRPAASSSDGRKGRLIEGGYVLEADGTIGFRIGRHDPSATLVIDPSISLAYTSFLGGTGNDSANSLAVDSSGNLYVGGTTTSAASFPEAGSTMIGPSGGATDLFIAKIDPSKSGANSLVYLTFLGGTGNQTGGLVAVDSAGNLAVAGTTTSSNFPVTDGSKLTTGSNDAIVSEIDPTGSTMVYSTIFGDNGAEAAQGAGGIAIDSAGDIFVASDTSSTNLPVTAGAYQSIYGAGISDGFLAIFQPTATPHLKYCTYLGIDALVGVGGVAVDASGNAYLAGYTTDPGTSFPAKNAFQTAYGGDPDDSFVMKILPGGKNTSDLIFATLLGGEDLDEAYAIAVDNASPPNVYVTGTTQSLNFPMNGAVAGYATTLNTNATANAFATVISQNAGKASLAYSTYLGGSRVDSGDAIYVIAANSVYVAGSTTSFDFPWLNNIQPFNGDADAFVVKMDPTSAGAASLLYSTPLGGTAPPGGTVTAVGQGIAAIAANGVTSVYVAGQTTAADFPTAGYPENGFQLICGSCQESPPLSNGFVVGIQESTTSQPSVYFSSAYLNFGLQPVGSTSVQPQFVAVYNGGEINLQISTIGITGPNAGDFSLQNSGACLSAEIAPGTFCSFEVGFIPSMVGPESASVSFATNAPGNPQVLELRATGEGPIASLSTYSLNFGNQVIGGAGSSQPITITNTGTLPLILAAVSTAGPNPNLFVVSGTNECSDGFTVNAGSSCTFDVTFLPAATGSFSAQLIITDNSGNVSSSQQVVQLTGTGVPPGPVVNLQPSSVAFGSQAVGTSGAAQAVLLTNTGSAGLNLTGITITGSNPSDFSIAAAGANPCPMPNGTLVTGGNCTVGVFFAPQTSGAKTANLSFADNAVGSPQIVQLTGTATSPSIQISPTSLNFNPQSMGTTSAPPLAVTLTNTATTALAINTIGVTGADASDFAVSNNCPSSLAGGANCILNVSFTPAAAGGRTASLNIADNAAGSPQMIALSGTGTQAAVSLSAASLSFGSQLAGASSAPVTITVTNTGNGALIFSGVSTTGTNATDFAVGSDTCMGTSVNIAPNATCTMQITFTPACSNSAAARSATLSLADNAAGSPQSIPISGTATGNFCFVAPAAGLTKSVSSGGTAIYSLNLTAANGYSGAVALSTSSCPPNAVCTAPSSENVAGNAQETFQVSIATQTGAASGQLVGPLEMWATPPRLRPGSYKLFAWVGLLAMVSLFAWISAMKTRGQILRLLQIACLVCGIAICFAACGSGGSNSGGGGDPDTPPGTYTVTLTGTANGTPQSIPLTLVVTN
jgi:hypothetical protein